MEAQVLEEGCINGRRGTGVEVYQWKNRSGSRGVTMEEQVWKEGCINRRTGLEGGLLGGQKYRKW